MGRKRVLIVGGVAGGAACAARLRRLDEEAEIVVFERGPDVSFANCGLPYYLGGVIRERSKLLVASPERFRDWLNVEVRTRHEVVAIDRAAKTIAVRGEGLGGVVHEKYDALVLAAGALPVLPSWPGIDLPGIFTLRNLEDTDRIAAWIQRRQPPRAVVVGAGYIGLEMAENLARQGIEVVLIEAADHVMPQADREMVAPLEAELRRQGVDVRLGAAVSAFEELPERMQVVFGGGQRMPCAMVVLAVGVRPNVALAQQAGLEIGQRGGVRVDAQMKTSDPAIWAVGDMVEVRDTVTGQWTLTALAGPAARQGRVAADAICRRTAAFRGCQATAVVGVFDVTFAMTGATEARLAAAGVPHRAIVVHAAHHAGYYPGAEMISLKVLYAPEDGRILGAQAVGRAGVEKRIDVIAMAMQKGGTVFDLEEAELCYAPQFGTVKDPANLAGFVAGNALRGDVDPVAWADWVAVQSSAEKPLVVDVRTAGEHSAGAVPGAVNIPLGELRARLDEIPRDREIWVHCGVGQRSYYASRILRQHGFRVRNLSGGMRSFQMLPKE